MFHGHSKDRDNSSEITLKQQWLLLSAVLLHLLIDRLISPTRPNSAHSLFGPKGVSRRPPFRLRSSRIPNTCHPMRYSLFDKSTMGPSRPRNISFLTLTRAVVGWTLSRWLSKIWSLGISRNSIRKCHDHLMCTEIAGRLIKRRYKNFKCTTHNKFFEVNLYQKDPVNLHHWRLNIARPASDIDLWTFEPLYKLTNKSSISWSGPSRKRCPELFLEF